MAVVLRLRREGKKKQPFYRIVATDERFPRDGRFIEIVGQFNPMPKEETVNIKRDRFIYWMSVGAKPSVTLKNVLRRAGHWKDIVSDLEALHARNKMESSNPIKTDEPVKTDEASEPTAL